MSAIAGTPVSPGTVFIDRYEVQDEIGRGGMGVVYRGHDHLLGRLVAIKVLPEAFNTDSEIIARFGREARAMAALDHPNIVPVYDTGRQDNFHFFVMKFLEGKTVADKLDAMRESRAKPYSPEEVRNIISQVCRGLGHAHKRGMIHRDIKPGNIMVGPDGHVTIMDFGIVKAQTSSDNLTKTGIVFGTPEYMAPEQAQGKAPPSPATDIYSLGIVAYEMLTGEPPFKGSTAFSLVLKHIKDPPPPLVSRRPDLDQAFQDVVFCTLEKEPEDRYPDALAMRAALEQLRFDLPPPPMHAALVTGDMLRQAPMAEIPARVATGVLPPVASSGSALPMVRAAVAPSDRVPQASVPPVTRSDADLVELDDAPAVLEDRPGHYRDLLTAKGRRAQERSRRRHHLLIGAVAAVGVIGLALIIFALMRG